MGNSDTEQDGALADEWFGRNFRGAREAMGMSQERVAELMKSAGFPHFSQSTVQRAESGGRGKGRSVSIGEGFALGRIVGVSADVLIQPPHVARLREELARAVIVLDESRANASMAAHDARFRAEEVARLVAEARDGEMSADLADEIARAERVLEGGRP